MSLLLIVFVPLTGRAMVDDFLSGSGIVSMSSDAAMWVRSCLRLHVHARDFSVACDLCRNYVLF